MTAGEAVGEGGEVAGGERGDFEREVVEEDLPGGEGAGDADADPLGRVEPDGALEEPLGPPGDSGLKRQRQVVALLVGQVGREGGEAIRLGKVPRSGKTNRMRGHGAFAG